MKDKAIKAAMNSIENRICHVYNQGYEDGFICGKQSAQIDKSTAYKAGLEAAWELARKLYNLGFNDTRKEIFGEKYGLSMDIIKDFSVDEVMTKIKDIPIRCRCEILHDKCPYYGKKCQDCNLYTAFHEAKKDIGGNLMTRWIPVSERLPEKHGEYLVTVSSSFCGEIIFKCAFATDLHKVDEYNFQEHKCGFYGIDSEWGSYEINDVIAWMPLPEPYRKESEGE